MSRRPLVLVADPIGSTRDLLAEVLHEDLDAHVTTLASAGDLETATHETKPDLIVVEVGRDRVAEVEALRALKAANPAIPMLVLTAWQVARGEAIETRVGAEKVIHKPFELDEFIRATRELLDLGGP